MKKKILFLLTSFFSLVLFSQKLKFPEQKEFVWLDSNFIYPVIPDSLINEDVVIIKDEFSLVDRILTRRVVLKVLSKEGIKKASHFVLPEDMDLVNFSNENRLGRFKNQRTPFCYTYNIKYFSARVIRLSRGPIDVVTSCTNSEAYWVGFDGQRIKQQVFDFKIDDIGINDIVEIAYKVEVGWAKLFVSLNSYFPRLSLKVKANMFLGFHNLRPQDTMQFRKLKPIDGIYEFEFKNLKSVNYPNNGGGLRKLPYLVFGQYSMRWGFVMDSISRKKYNTKEQISFRRYAEQFERKETDSSGNKMLSVLIDSINNLNFISAESLHYSGESQYAITSAEHLLKGRFMEEFTIKIYDRLLEEKKVFFYVAILGDKRKSEIHEEFYSNTVYKETVFAVPEGKSIVFYKTRKNGLKYFPNELPFYLENTKCALIPQNVQFINNKAHANKMGFTRTPKSSFNDNVRVEAGRCLISTDSMKVRLTIKESLNGQFSTILRPYYNKDHIDSTVSPNYFKKCTDKPNAFSVIMKKGSVSNVFPFKHTYNCEESISLLNPSELNLKEWFSFLINGEEIIKKPNHDFYFDFQFTDTYNYLFEFDKPVEIVNMDDFAKKISNEYFEINSNLVKQEVNKYLLSVVIKVKQEVLPHKEAQKMIDFVSILDAINQLKLNYKVL